MPIKEQAHSISMRWHSFPQSRAMTSCREKTYDPCPGQWVCSCPHDGMTDAPWIAIGEPLGWRIRPCPQRHSLPYFGVQFEGGGGLHGV